MEGTRVPHRKTRGFLIGKNTRNVHKLIGAAFVDYARLLRSLGLREGAALWASRAGGPGEQLMEELFQGEGGTPEGLTPADQETGPGVSGEEGDEDRKFAIVEE
ncbi:unnamed protein product [Arctogadus glacialis]